MKRMEISKWLKGITIVVGIMGILFFFLYVPLLAEQLKDAAPEAAFLFWPCLSLVWVIAGGCYAVLFLFWKVSNEIQKDNSFSKENARYFVWISRVSLSFTIVWFVGMILLGVSGWLHPSIALIMIVGVIIGVAVSILSAALSHLIWKAYEMKQENELTI